MKTNILTEYERKLLRILESLTNDLNSAFASGSLSSFFEENEPIDFIYLRDTNDSLYAIRVYLTLGGPCIWIDTEYKIISIRNGLAEFSNGLSYDLCEEIENFFRSF